MILILSIEQDLSTHNVIDWLDFYRTKWEVIYFENFISVNSDILNLEKLFKSASVIWFRKWGSSSLLSHTQQIVLSYLYYCGKNAYWINSDKDKNINKIIQLDIAKSVGLKIPQTYILNTKEKLKEILIQKSSIITKALVPQDLIIENDECYVNYTDRISIDEIKKQFNNEFDDIIDEYYEFLFSNDFIFKTNYPELFPKLNLQWDSSSVIENTIITIKNPAINYEKIFDELEYLGCKAIEIRVLSDINMELIKKVLNYTNDKSLSHVNLIMPWVNNMSLEDCQKEVNDFPRIWDIKVYNAPENKCIFLDEQKEHPINCITTKINDHSFCGNIYPNNFVNNITFFTESINYNTCLNRKLCIDENGYIKNCPSMSKHYGHISNTNVAEVVQSEEFQKLWHIKKDDIKVCKDCEFRHMCMDCRAYIKNPNDIYSQPAKCPYNPYIAKWQGQESYITVEQWQKENPNWEQQAKEQRQTTY